MKGRTAFLDAVAMNPGCRKIQETRHDGPERAEHQDDSVWIRYGLLQKEAEYNTDALSCRSAGLF